MNAGLKPDLCSPSFVYIPTTICRLPRDHNVCHEAKEHIRRPHAHEFQVAPRMCTNKCLALVMYERDFGVDVRAWNFGMLADPIRMGVNVLPHIDLLSGTFAVPGSTGVFMPRLGSNFAQFIAAEAQFLVAIAGHGDPDLEP